MRLAAGAVAYVLLIGASCGYVGPVLPPSPQIPATITDLTAVERGDKIIIHFTVPARTTDGVAITHFSKIDLRIGPEGQDPAAAKAYDVPLPAPSDRDDPQPKPVSQEVPASEWTGQRIAVQARSAVKEKGHESAWSNRVMLDVLAPLDQPAVAVASSAQGIVLTWQAADGVEYLVQRQGTADGQPVDIGSVNGGTFLDKTAAYDTPYRYSVTARKGAAESLPFTTEPYSAIDNFAPAVPTGLTALAGNGEINLAWQRNTEPDLQGYYVYRSSGGTFERVGGLIAVPSFADHGVQPGNTYRYKISSIDKKGNESVPSAPVEVQF